MKQPNFKQGVKMRFKPLHVSSYDTDIIFELASGLKAIVGGQTVSPTLYQHPVKIEGCEGVKGYHAHMNGNYAPTKQTNVIKIRNARQNGAKCILMQTAKSFQGGIMEGSGLKGIKTPSAAFCEKTSTGFYPSAPFLHERCTPWNLSILQSIAKKYCIHLIDVVSSL